ncbi:MAG: hypothetical protein WCW31_05600 [Patescibacteria group bacterium]|jgi:hypothetical protein
METYDGRGFTEGELKAASWWVKNEVRIYYWSKIVLYALNAIVWGYVLWGLLDAYAISYPRESRITAEIAADQQALSRLMEDIPRNVGTSQVLVFQGTDKRVDMMVDLENANDQWWAEFTYSFNVAGEQTAPHQGFILPKQTITLTELGFKPKAAGARSAQLLVDNIRWHRVEPSKVGGDYDKFINDRFGGVKVQNVNFDRVDSVSRTSFDVADTGAYGFWSIDFVVKLLRGSTVVGVNQVNLQQLKPGEIRHVDLMWFENIPGVTKTEIVPIVNLLDPGAYLPSSRL